MNTYCHGCGSRLEKAAKFCPNCGIKTVDLSDNEPISVLNNEALFYSENWKRLEFFVVAAHSYYDILIDKNYLYLIAIRNYNNAGFYMLIGLLFFQILGAIAGYFIGSSSDNKKRQQFRSTWIDSNQKLISQDYENNIFLKIPLTDIKSSLVFQKNKLIINYKDLERKLRKNQNETQRLRNYIESHVL